MVVKRAQLALVVQAKVLCKLYGRSRWIKVDGVIVMGFVVAARS
jgi:hypothetical protein